MVDEADHLPGGLAIAGGGMFWIVGFVSLVLFMLVLSGAFDRWLGRPFRITAPASQRQQATDPNDEPSMGLSPATFRPEEQSARQ